jgi:hypothetical protein
MINSLLLNMHDNNHRLKDILLPQGDTPAFRQARAKAMSRPGCPDQCRCFKGIPYEEGLRLKEEWDIRASLTTGMWSLSCAHPNTRGWRPLLWRRGILGAIVSSHGASTLGIKVPSMSLKMAGINSPFSLLLQGTYAQRVPQRADFLKSFPVENRLVYANSPRSGMEAKVLSMLGESGHGA